jgi:CIC family chloride channel protein
MEDFFDAIKRIPEWFKPAIGGALLGVLALSYPLITLTQPVTWDRTPHIFNVGYDIIEGALANNLLFGAALLLLVAKILATIFTLGSGGSGGVFAPSLFMGAMLGAAFELGLNRLFPGISAPPGAYALVGMAAVFAASAHAPITAVIILFELTGDYRIILPLMLTVVVSTLISQLILKGESIYTLKLSRRGVRLDRGRDLDILQGVSVGEVMTKDFETVSKDTRMDELAEIFVTSHHHGLMVLDEGGKLWGLVTLTDLDRAVEENRPESTSVADIATSWPHLQTAFPDETMGDALARMGSRGLGRLPVVAREDPYQLLGLLWREGISRAYALALTRREEIEQRTKRLQKHYEEEAEFVEISLVSGDSAIGNTVESYSSFYPKDCVLVSIRRDDRTIIPHGDTVFQTGDQVTAFVRKQDAVKLFQCLHGPEESIAV